MLRELFWTIQEIDHRTLNRACRTNGTYKWRRLSYTNETAVIEPQRVDKYEK